MREHYVREVEVCACMCCRMSELHWWGIAGAGHHVEPNVARLLPAHAVVLVVLCMTGICCKLLHVSQPGCLWFNRLSVVQRMLLSLYLCLYLRKSIHMPCCEKRCWVCNTCHNATA